MWRIEVGLLPGMTDNVGRTAGGAISDIVGQEYPVYYSRVFYIDAEFEELTDRLNILLGNILIN